MEQTEAEEIVKTLRTDLAFAKSEVEAANRKVTVIEGLINGLLTLFPDIDLDTISWE